MSEADYLDGVYDGMKRALAIVRHTEPAPNTRCESDRFAAARGRIVRRLASAVARNEPVPSPAGLVEQDPTNTEKTQR